MITQLLELATGSYLFHTCQVVTIVADQEAFDQIYRQCQAGAEKCCS